MRPALLAAYTFARPGDTTAYAAGDLIANSTTAASVVFPSWTVPWAKANDWVLVAGVLLRKSSTGVTGASFRVHLLDAAATAVTNGDNSATSTVVATGMGALGTWHGHVTGTLDTCGVDGGHIMLVPPDSVPIWVRVSATKVLHGVLEARGAYAPGNAESLSLRPLLLA